MGFTDNEKVTYLLCAQLDSQFKPEALEQLTIEGLVTTD